MFAERPENDVEADRTVNLMIWEGKEKADSVRGDHLWQTTGSQGFMLSLNTTATTSIASLPKHCFPPEFLEPSKQPRASPRLCPLMNFLTSSALFVCFAKPVPQPLIPAFLCVSLPCLWTPDWENVDVVSHAWSCGDPLGILWGNKSFLYSQTKETLKTVPLSSTHGHMCVHTANFHSYYRITS